MWLEHQRERWVDALKRRLVSKLGLVSYGNWEDDREKDQEQDQKAERQRRDETRDETR